MPFQQVVQLDEFHAEAHIGLVASVEAHGILPGHAGERIGQFHAANGFEKVLGETFKYVQYVFLLYEAHFAVYLCKLRLTVSA
ncbi:hypothetical protein Barb7_02162 [Bacteroidales bacterium Barb7]|nr:hypothetical protein Barb7_02162 [Bacteroidales bacterium Barb7]